MVERQIVDLVVEGSNPFFHPKALLAQLDRVSDFESAGRRFESYRAREYNSWAASSAGRAADS